MNEKENIGLKSAASDRNNRLHSSKKLCVPFFCAVLLASPLLASIAHGQGQDLELIKNGDFNGLQDWIAEPIDLVNLVQIPPTNETSAMLSSAPNTVVSLLQTIDLPPNATSLKISWIDHGLVDKDILSDYRVGLYDANMTKLVRVLFRVSESVQPSDNSFRWNWGLHTTVINMTDDSPRSLTLVFDKHQGDGTSWVLIDQVSATAASDNSPWNWLQIPLGILLSLNQTLSTVAGWLLGIAALFSLLCYFKTRNLRKKIEFIESYIDALVQTRKKEA